MLVEVGTVGTLSNAVEIREKVDLGAGLLDLCASRLLEQVVDEHLRVYLLLDVERWRLDDDVAPVLVVLAAPDKLRVKVWVVRVTNLSWSGVFSAEYGLVLGRRDVSTLVPRVPEGLDVLRSA